MKMRYYLFKKQSAELHRYRVFSLNFVVLPIKLKTTTCMTTSKLISKSLLLLFLTTATLFTSCKDKETTVDQSSETVQEATLDQKKQMLDNVVPGNSTNANSGNMAGMNPEHGQPGHRCDIKVGDPL